MLEKRFLEDDDIDDDADNEKKLVLAEASLYKPTGPFRKPESLEPGASSTATGQLSGLCTRRTAIADAECSDKPSDDAEGVVCTPDVPATAAVAATAVAVAEEDDAAVAV